MKTEIDNLRRRIGRLPVTAEELGIGEEIAMLDDFSEIGREDPFLLEILEERVSEAENALLVSPFIDPPIKSGLDAGAIEILRTTAGIPVRISFENDQANAVTHLLVGGASGFGKSFFQAGIASACAASGIPTLILDPNRCYRKITSIRETHKIVRFSHLRINLYEGIHGVPVAVSDQVVTREICATYGLQYGEYEIGEALRDIRRNGKPSLPALISHLAAKRYSGFSRRSQYRDSAVLILSNLLEASGSVFDCAVGMDLTKIMRHNVVLEIDELLPIHQAFFTRFLFEMLHLVALSGRGNR